MSHFVLKPPLAQALFSEDTDEFLRTLEASPEDARQLDSEKRSLLHAAAFLGEVEITKALLALEIEPEIDVNAKDNNWLTPLHRACKSGNEVMKTCL